MKKTMLITTALFLSVAAIAQTKVTSAQDLKSKTSVQKSANGTSVGNDNAASSNTTIQSDAGAKVKGRTKAEIKKEKKALAAKKAAAEATLESTKEGAKTMASQDASVAASVQSDAAIKADAQGNNVSNNSSINGDASVSTVTVKNTSKEVAVKSIAAVETNVAATAETGAQVTTEAINTSVITTKKVKGTSATTVNNGASSVKAVQPKPVTVKTAAQVTTNAGIKLR